MRRFIPVVLAPVLACGGTQLPTQEITSPGEALFNGRVRANINCYSCHNGDATGTWHAPDLTQRVPALTDTQIADAIAKGPGLMPSFKGKLSDAEVREIIAWLRSRASQTK